jgi:hypothetical protein
MYAASCAAASTDTCASAALLSCTPTRVAFSCAAACDTANAMVKAINERVT